MGEVEEELFPETRAVESIVDEELERLGKRLLDVKVELAELRGKRAEVNGRIRALVDDEKYLSRAVKALAR